MTACLDATERDEMAVPSYCHPNPLIRRLFWQRLDAAIALAELRPGDRIFDYGLGAGVLLPSYAAVALRIAGTDLHPGPARAMADALGVPLELVPLPDLPRWVASNAGAFDRIFALDVLEHVADAELAALSARLATLLAPGGRLVVSGPTETRLYALGRLLAGFHNAYHHRSVFDVDRVLAAAWTVDARRAIPRGILPRAFVVTRYVRRS